MTDFSKTSLSPLEDGSGYGDIYNNLWTSSSSSDGSNEDLSTFSIGILYITPFFCVVGLLGNGIVICLLGFHIKRSPFTTYILNLAVADFGLPLFGILFLILLLTLSDEYLLFLTALTGASCMYGASQLILTTISIDRCVSVLFPLWHRCHRPSHLSTTVCALIWVLTSLPSGSQAILYILAPSEDELPVSFFLYQFLVGAVLCLPLVTFSTLILFLKVFCKSQQPQRGRLLTIVLLTLLFFLIFAFPLNAIVTLNYFTSFEHAELILCGVLCACLNSCVNPVIYYLVGRKKRGRQRQNLKVILQRAFKEEEEGHGEERGTTAQTSLCHLRNS